MRGNEQAAQAYGVQTLFTLYTDAPERFGVALAELDGGWSVRDTTPASRPLIIDRIVT